MTRVFFLMWLSDIAGGVSIVGYVALAALALSMIAAAIMASADDSPTGLRRAWTVARWLLIPVVIAVACPNSTTIRLLAVASAAETLASTQLGAKSIQAINAVLDRVIAEAVKK